MRQQLAKAFSTKFICTLILISIKKNSYVFILMII